MLAKLVIKRPVRGGVTLIEGADVALSNKLLIYMCSDFVLLEYYHNNSSMVYECARRIRLTHLNERRTPYS